MMDREKCPDKPRSRKWRLTKLVMEAAKLLIIYWTIYATFLVITTERCLENKQHTLIVNNLQTKLDALLSARINDKNKLKYNEEKPIHQSPSLEYETIRRRVYSNTKDALDYIGYELENAIEDSNNTIRLQRLRTLIEQVRDRKSVLLADQQRMWAVDGYAEWRKREVSEVSALVQHRLRALQNPPNCEAARKLICDFQTACGFGCQLHHVMFCLNFAFATRRTLVLRSNSWYYKHGGWEDIFSPLSVNCTQIKTKDRSKTKIWSAALDSDWNVLRLPSTILEDIQQSDFKAKFLPPAIPKDVAERISRINGDPLTWWRGQLLRYIFRPRADVADEVYRFIANMNFSNNTVGIHIRRTDKLILEADFHPFYEYMNQVKDYWRIQDLFTGTTVPRRVYIATDDPTVKGNATKAYPDVEFLGDQKIASIASNLRKRNSRTAIFYLVAELAVLERCDYFVGTFTSNIGRLVYELMQTNRPDASESVYSLDNIYYIYGQKNFKRIALLPHIPKQAAEIELQKGDIVEVKSFYKIRRAYGYGTNQRTNKTGHWPWYKTEYQVETYPFPTFENEDNPALLSTEHNVLRFGPQ